jgi:hypothetical protein
MTQMMSALLGLRGTNLKWGLQVLMETLVPEQKGNTEKLVNRILHHRLISDSTFAGVSRAFPLASRWKLASAIRKEELIAVLHNLHEMAKDPHNADEEIKKLEAPIKQVLKAISVAPIADISRLITEIHLMKGETAAAEKKAAELVRSIRKSSDEFAFWFDACMDRVSQRFAMKIRLWTVAVALVTAFVLHLDALKLVTQFWADPEERASLVSAAESMANQAGMILGTDNNGAPTLYTKAIADLKSGPFADSVKSLNPSGTFATQTEAETWLRAQLVGNPHIEGIVQQYRTLVGPGVHAKLSDLQAQVAAIKRDLEQAKFELIPSPYTWQDYWSGLRPTWAFLGTLAAAALLSLGAPFWFHTLKSLSNLRPLLAQKQEDAEKKKAVG